MASEIDGRFGFVAVGTAGSFEFEAAIVGYVDQFVRMIDQKRISGKREAAPIRGCAELIEIRCREARLIGHFDDAACVDAVDTAAVVGVEGKGSLRVGVKARLPFPCQRPAY